MGTNCTDKGKLAVGNSFKVIAPALIALAVCALKPSWAAPPQTFSASFISPGEQSVYEAIVDEWLQSRSHRQLINQWLEPPPSASDPDYRACAKGLNLVNRGSDPSKSLVGVRFRRRGAELVDGKKWLADDPGKLMGRGYSVRTAVERGFSHSLITVSQIVFSADGNDALVNFRMVCGALCGNGAMLRMHRSRGLWRTVDRCGDWMS
jgi:hypothetical protein